MGCPNTFENRRVEMAALNDCSPSTITDDQA